MKNKIFILFIISLFCAIQGKGQDMHKAYLDSGMVVITSSPPEIALDYYMKAFSYRIPDDPRRIYEAAVLSVRTGQIDQAFLLLQLSIDKGFSALDHIRRNQDFPALNDPRFDLCMQRIEERDLLLQKLTLRLDSIFHNDQEIRLKYNQQLREDNIAGTLREKEILEQMTRLDSMNIQAVEEIISQYGFWGHSLKTTTSRFALWAVIQHAPYPIRKRYTPLLEEAVRRDELSASLLAYVLDRNGLEEYGKQKYGTQYEIRDKEVIIFDLLNPDLTNQYRKEMGLPTLEEYIQQVKKEQGLETN